MNIQGITLKSTFIIMTIALLTSGCASNKALKNPVQNVMTCSAGKCQPVAQFYSNEQLLKIFRELITVNDTQKIPICSADLKNHTCKSEKVCYLVLGGLLPGNGCAENLLFNDVEKNTAVNQIDMKTVMPLSFIGTSVSCAPATTKLSIKSANEISIELEPYHCSWMVMGQMRASFSFFIDWIDRDSGQIGGHWNHSVAGTGNGSGSGYAILKFPKNIPWKP